MFRYLEFSLLAEFAAFAFVKFATEALLYKVVEAVAKGFELHVVDDFVDEGILEQHLRLLQGDASLAHVEEGGIVELAYGRAVGTLHVVGIDLEHGLGVHAGILGGREVLVGHLRGGLLGSVFNQDTTCKGASGLLVEHVLIEFVRGAMGHVVGDERVVIHMLLLVGNHTAIALALSTLAREGEVEFIASNAVVEGDDVMVHPAVGLLVDIDIAHANILIMCLLKTIEVERGILAHIGLDDPV